MMLEKDYSWEELVENTWSNTPIENEDEVPFEDGDPLEGFLL